ncbi:MAG: Asp-tRNA(Asn)/Glu-tRNA(Gln) amidotransferase subunit GatB [Candidatus Magasanikbacteria bacterium]|nr:Asp-tRNA(Asn)/Glu-tRNA(Gln) amidotransferase subunit GatB [Candidatus Magasanikbacteria bacterium]
MYQVVIGLEIHAQIKTQSKMFCGCPQATDGLPPNTALCPICTGQPGTLPVLNLQALKLGIKTGLALHCRINAESKFDRKHYFYPDLPKAYQISQYDQPIAEDGFLEIEIPDEETGEIVNRKIRIQRLHLEEDAAKLLHGAEENHAYVDFNRAGSALMEMVTHPDVASPAEAKLFLQELRLILRYLGASDANMEKGQMRCDANISLRPMGDTAFYTKTEVKNMNSFKSVERALEFEIERQTKLWDAGTPPDKLSTRGWDDIKQITVLQRIKEDAADYRYFPEPDIPPLHLDALAKEMAKTLPELPAARRARFIDEYELSLSDARILTDDLNWANFTEQTFSELYAWLRSLPDMAGLSEEQIIEKNSGKLARLVGGYLTSKLMGLMADKHIDIRTLKITPENFAEFIALLYTNKISGANTLTLLKNMFDGEDPAQIMEEKQLGQVEDAGLIARAVDEVLKSCPEQVTQFKSGKTSVLQFLIGKIMKEMQGRADPGAVREALLQNLK